MGFLNHIYIEKYRGIQKLKLNHLQQINLILGDNNCGKTSVLEAIELFRTSGDLANIYRIARQRDSLSLMSANSVFDSFLCIFPRDHDSQLEVSVSGICNNKDISFRVEGKQYTILLDTKELPESIMKASDVPRGEVEAEAFMGTICLKYGEEEQRRTINVNQYSSISGTPLSHRNRFRIVYVSPFEHLRGEIISRIIRVDSYKQVCIRALQLFDPNIEDLMIFRSDAGNRPVEYLRHKKLGDMPVSSYGDGIKKVLALSNAIAQAADGILLIDEIETSIHKKYYDDIFRFIVKACKAFHVQAFITTHSVEAIDGLLSTQDYEAQQKEDDICVCTLRKTDHGTLSRLLPGREVYENREAFGFEVRL